MILQMTKDDTYDIGQVQFNPLKVEEFIDYAYVNIALNWVLRVLRGIPALQEVFSSSNTKASEAIINDVITWKKFSDSCFIPLSDVNNWSHGIYRLKDPLLLTSISEDTRFNLLE